MARRRTPPASAVLLTLALLVTSAPTPNLTPGRLAEDELSRLLAHHPVTGRPVDSIDELLPLLPAPLRENFTFVHTSRSPHGGLGDKAHASVDELHPRALLFSPDARLVLAFTTAPDRPGADELEVLRFHDQGARFSLARYVLPAAVRRDPTLAAAAAHNGERDPPECLRCHGRDVRPIYDSYPLWPGLYGSVQDTFPDAPEQAGGPLVASRELAAYRRFLAEARDRGPLRHLRWPAGTSVPPYTDPRQYDPAAVEGSPDQLRLQPNTRLGMALAELARKRTERRFATSPRHARDRYGALAVLLGCEVPPLDLEDHAAVRARLGAESAERLDRLGFRPRGPGGELHLLELGAAGNAARVLYAARLLGVDARDLGMAFEPGSLALYDGVLGQEREGRSYYLSGDLALEMLRHLARDEPAFAPFFVTRASFASAGAGGYPFGEKLDLGAALRACPLLLERQQQVGGRLPDVAALGAWVATPPPSSGAEPPSEPAAPPPRSRSAAPEPPEPPEPSEISPLLDKCSKCHEGTGALRTGRPLPLGSPALLGPLLDRPAFSSDRALRDEILARLRSHGADRMPPHGPAADAAQVAALHRHLDAITARRAP